LISLSILAAVGIAVYENPQVKEWVEEQRRKITEFLATFGDQLDPQSRREAEAFAYEGRIPTQTPEEAAGMANAIARATGRETTDEPVIRRNRTSEIPQSPDEADARRRLGREYLAKRNQEMLDLREKQKMRRSTSELSEKTPPSPTFDQFVDVDGSLKKDTLEQSEEFNEKTLELPSVPTDEPKSLGSTRVQEPALLATAFTHGSRYANPFGDEFELSGTLDSRSPTPKPPVPPKIAIEDTNKLRRLSVTQKEPSIRQIPILDEVEDVPADLSYEEQLVRAMSISLAESEEAARQARLLEQEQRDTDFAAAVAASLADVERVRQKQQQQQQQPTNEELINLTPDPPVSVPVTSELTDDELYTLSPRIQSRRAIPAALLTPMVMPPYDPVHEAAATSSALHPQTPLPAHTPTTATFSSPEIERDAISLSSASSSTTDDFASAPASVAASESEMSLIDFGEVESVDSGEESEDDGVLTPGSWTDVGSDVGSEDLEEDRR
jgi:hypothetical protein